MGGDEEVCWLMIRCGEVTQFDVFGILSQSFEGKPIKQPVPTAAVFQDLEGDENGLCTATNANVCGEQGFAETLGRVVLC